MLREHLASNFDQAGAGGVVFETAAADILAPEGTIQSQPADSAGDVMGAAQNPAIAQDARADTRADGEEDRVAAAFGDAAPRFAQNVTGPVAVEDDSVVRERSEDFAAERVILPAGDVGRPNFARSGVTDARDRNADGVHVKSFGAGGG